MADPVSLAITVALTAAQMALTMSRTIEGPRLTDLNVSVADYGTPLNYVYGSRRVQCPAFYCEPIKEKKKKRKTKGGKYAEYTYYGTWASHLADHEIVSVEVIWLNLHKAFDSSLPGGGLPSGASTEWGNALTSKSSVLEGVRFYYGGEDQEPDPRMLATVEAKLGAGTCPAYRGTSYIFWEDFPLEQSGNRFPQVSAQITTAGVGDHHWVVDSDVIAGTPDWSPAYWQQLVSLSQSGQYIAGGHSTDTNYVADLSSGTPVLAYAEHWDGVTYMDGADEYIGFDLFAVDDEGSVWGNGGYNGGGSARGNISEVTLADPTTPVVRYTWTQNGGNSTGLDISAIYPFTLPGGSIMLVMIPRADSWNNNPYYFTATKGTPGLTEATLGGSWYPNSAFQDDNGDVWIAGTLRVVGAGTDQVHFQRITDVTGASPYPASQTITGLPEIDTTGGVTVNAAHVWGFVQDGHYVGAWAGGPSDIYAAYSLVRIPLDGSDTFTLVDVSSAPVYPLNSTLLYPYFPPEPDRFFVMNSAATFFTEMVATDLSFGDGYSRDVNWDAPDDGEVGITFWVDAIGAFAGNQGIYQNTVDFEDLQGDLYLYFPGGDDVSLATIVRDVSARVGLVDGTDFACDELEEVPINGYSWSQGPAKDIISWLLDVYDCVARPHDGTVEFIQRGRSPTQTLTTPDFSRVPNSPRYNLTVSNDTDLPRRIFFNFADMDADQQPNSAKSQRSLSAVDSVRETSIDGTTLALSADEAQSLVDRHFRRRWFSRVTAEHGLTPRHLAIEPGDVEWLDFDGSSMIMQLDKQVIRTRGSMALTWSQDDPALAGLPNSYGAPMTGRPPSVIPIPGDSVAFILDTPLLDDADEQTAPIIYAGAASEDGDNYWMGAEVMASDDGTEGSFEAWESFATDQSSAWGTVTGTPPDALPWIIDDGAAITVVLATGTLTSITEEQMLNDGTRNLAAIGNEEDGWELFQFQTATLVDERTYELTGRLRGVRGTEQFIPTHGAGETFVLLDNVRKHTLGASEIGDTDHYKPVSAGWNEDTADAGTAIDYQANSHRPYAPVHGTLTQDGADWLIDATRRTRVGASALDGMDVPLGETSESWEADVMDGITVVRTLTGTSLPLTYLEADQITDFGSAQSSLDVILYQMSPALSLRGFPLALAA
jgi:hypothetical protein